jgi:5-formyltetrahydrofolate cyclo-ligase
MTTQAELKTEMRRSLLKTRRAMPPDEWMHKSQQICHHLKTFAPVQNATTILAYFSIRQEPDLSPLFTSSQRWGFSRCQGKDLIWHQWSPGDALTKGAFGIAEPLPTAPLILPHEVDVILVPAVACDRPGYRLGYGGGFYDRLLSQSEWASQYTIGIIFDVARVDTLPTEPWDRPLRAVCTEKGLFER